MKLLSLSTAEQGASLAVFKGEKLICEEYWASGKTHSQRLVSMVENLLENRAGFKLQEIDAFLAARGPGSFTGLRIGISMVKGFAHALARPQAGVSSLDGIGWRFSHSDLPVCVMMDARRGEVYSAVYRFSRGALQSKSQERVCAPEQALASVGKGSAIFAGSGSKAFHEAIEKRMGHHAVFSPLSMDYVSAAALARPVFFDSGFFERPENFLTPSYIRKSDAEIQFVEKTRILT